MSLAPGRTRSHYRLKDGIYVQDADGGEPKRIFKSDPDDVYFYILGSWLPDGSALLLRRFAPSGQGKLALLPLTGGEADSTRLRPLLPSTAQNFGAVPRLSRDGRVFAFDSDESGKELTYVAELHADGSTGRPIEVRTSGSVAHQWSTDGKTLFVEDARHRLMRVAVTAAPTLSLSAPTEVHDLDKLRVQMWSVLPDGRFFVGLRNENEDEITRYSLVQNWTEELKRKMRDAR